MTMSKHRSFQRHQHTTMTRPHSLMSECWLTIVWICLLAPFATVSALSSTAPVRVQVQQSLQGVTTPKEAKEAWLSYQWKQRGGLPILVTHSDQDKTRRLFPIGMQETLDEGSDDNQVRYHVTDMGLLSADLQENSHEATVHFVQDTDNDSINMVWDVEFQAKHRAEMWKTVTQLNIQTASANLASHVAVPRLYRRTTRLSPRDNATMKLSKDWIDFVWRQGGGLPVPKPIQLDDEKRVQVPPFLVERLVHIKEDEIQYTVDNPGLVTYQVHSHAGRVRFQSIPDSDETEMVWEVEVRPWRGFTWLVQSFTSAVITTLARNFKVHVNEPNAVVMVAPPRGKGEAFGQVPKDSWLGGVLAAHLSDKRSTVEQTLAIFQPWTWGRSTDDDGEEAEWTTGYMSEYRPICE